jgi:hypothetical protein
VVARSRLLLFILLATAFARTARGTADAPAPSNLTRFDRFDPSDSLLGMGAVGAFLLVVALLLVWALVTLEGTVRFEEGSRQILNALVRKSGSHARYVVNVAKPDEAGSFGPRGWGISASNAWLDRRALRTLLDAADRISGAL